VEKLLALPKLVTPDILDRLSNLITSRLNAKRFADRYVQEIVRLWDVVTRRPA
jgi:hypothetical protein